MIILQKSDPRSSKTTVLAEIIAEFFDGQSVEQISKFGGAQTPGALKLLTDLKLIRIEEGKVVLTEAGRDFVRLPHTGNLNNTIKN